MARASQPGEQFVVVVGGAEIFNPSCVQPPTEAADVASSFKDGVAYMAQIERTKKIKSSNVGVTFITLPPPPPPQIVF